MDSPPAMDPEDVLAQPTRARLFALLGELKRAAGTVELAERLDLHPNGVRSHLERMEEAGRGGRGRAPRAPGPAPQRGALSSRADGGSGAGGARASETGSRATARRV